MAKKIAKERSRHRARKLNTEQCRELNRVRARERRWNNTEQCRCQGQWELKEEELKYPKNWVRRLQNFAQPCKKSRMFSSGDQQEKFNVFGVFRGITGKWTQLEKVVNSLIYRKDLFSSVIVTFAGSSGDRIHTEMSCHILVSDFVTLKRLRFSHILSSCFSVISL